jgi:Caspase domain
MKRFRLIAFLLMPLILLLFSEVRAERYAVLIGINDYPNVPPLYGPRNDVESLKKVLSGKYDIPSKNITSLLDSGATKTKIIQTISGLKSRTKAGDYIFIYFSGHGTSAYDKDTHLNMMSTTGAIVPYDAKVDGKNPAKTLESLIIGRRDLFPVFKELDRDRTLFVVFDSCYSGNAVRALRTGRGLSKFIPLDIPAETVDFSSAKDEPFPYASLVYLSAAHQTEAARDLSSSDGTFDGLPHGALTNYLLVGLNGEADLNHDGIITYEELYEFSRQKVQAFGHTPQIKSKRALAQPVFDRPGTVITNVSVPPPPPSATPVRVSVEGTFSQSITSGIASLSGIILTKERPDLRLLGTGENVRVLLSSGDELSTVDGFRDLRSRLQKFVASRELLDLNNSRQNFNVFLRPVGDRGRTVFFGGDDYELEVVSEAEAQLLVLDCDAEGQVTMLLPSGQQKENHITANKSLIINNLKVFPPLGVEFVKVFAFKTPVAGLQAFQGETIVPGTLKYEQLLALIRRQQGWSSTIMELVTMKR